MKKFKFLVGAMAVLAVVAVNVWNAATSFRGSELSVADVEAMANPEGMASLGFWRYDGTDPNCRYVTTSFTYEDLSVRSVDVQVCVVYYICTDEYRYDNCTPGEKRHVDGVSYYFWGGDYQNGHYVTSFYEERHEDNRPH